MRWVVIGLAYVVLSSGCSRQSKESEIDAAYNYCMYDELKTVTIQSGTSGDVMALQDSTGMFFRFCMKSKGLHFSLSEKTCDSTGIRDVNCWRKLD
jgi:hypothetical protein